MTLLLLIAAITVATVAMLKRRRRLRRAALFMKPFPRKWLRVLRRNVPLYSRLPTALQRELCGHINVFVAEKNFEGCGGLEMTDEIKVTVAAQACVLLLNRAVDYYPRLDSILVYPSSYIAPSRKYQDMLEFVGESHRLGESSQRGLVVLSWDDVLHGASDMRDGQNLIFHEFAHQLDQEDGVADGLPRLERRSQYISWARVLHQEYVTFVEKVERGAHTLLDHYGATDPAEFFSVLTETFFEKPKALRAKHPGLYTELQNFFKVDPRSWLDDTTLGD